MDLIIPFCVKAIGYTVLITAMLKTMVSNVGVLVHSYRHNLVGRCPKCDDKENRQNLLVLATNGRLEYMTREEAITQANSHGHKFDGTWTNEQHGGDEDAWPYKFRATCQLCNGIIVSHERPGDAGIPVIMGLPLTETCVKTYDYYTKSLS